MSDLAGENAFVDLRYSYHWHKYSCIREFYFIHIALCYVVFWSGIACFATRLVPPLKWTHVWFGRVYLIAMLLATVSAMLIHNFGLPLFVIYSFGWVLGGLCVGWTLIKFHEKQMEEKATAMVDTQLQKNARLVRSPLSLAILDAKIKIAAAKSWTQRVVSYKAAHGIAMLLSWTNIAGRILITGLDDEFTCFTHPIFKPVNSSQYRTKGMNLEGQPLQRIPIDDPNYDRLPWGNFELGWAMLQLFAPIIVALLFGSVFSVFAARRERQQMLSADMNTKAEPLATPETEMSAGS